MRLLKLILLSFLLTCASKKFIWQGQYIAVNTAEQPKEDLKVEKYIVVAYTPIEHRKNSDVIYKFMIYKNEKQVCLITVKYHPELPLSSTGEKMYIL